MQAQRGGRGIALSILKPGTRRWWVAGATPQPLYPRERDPLLIVPKACWAFGAGLDGPEIISPRPRFKPRTVQLAVIRYTVYAMSATSLEFIRKDKTGIVKYSISNTCLSCYQFHAIQTVLKVPGEFFFHQNDKNSSCKRVSGNEWFLSSTKVVITFNNKYLNYLLFYLQLA